MVEMICVAVGAYVAGACMGIVMMCLMMASKEKNDERM